MDIRTAHKEGIDSWLEEQIAKEEWNVVYHEKEVVSSKLKLEMYKRERSNSCPTPSS